MALATVKITRDYRRDGRCIEWSRKVDFSRVPCVGEHVAFPLNADGSRVEGEPIDSSVKYVWWDVQGNGGAAATIYLETERSDDFCLDLDDDRKWMEEQGWRMEWTIGFN